MYKLYGDAGVLPKSEINKINTVIKIFNGGFLYGILDKFAFLGNNITIVLPHNAAEIFKICISILFRHKYTVIRLIPCMD